MSLRPSAKAWMPPWGPTQGAGPGEGMWMTWGPGVSRTTSTVSAMVWAPWWGPHVIRRTHVPWKMLALGALLLASPHPSHAGDPSVWARGERSALEGEDPPLLTPSHVPTGEILAEGSVSAPSRATRGQSAAPPLTLRDPSGLQSLCSSSCCRVPANSWTPTKILLCANDGQRLRLYQERQWDFCHLSDLTLILQVSSLWIFSYFLEQCQSIGTFILLYSYQEV